MKRLLLIRATTDYSAEVVEHMKQICNLLGIEFVLYDYVNLDDFKAFATSEGSFDFLYLGAHGSHGCFGERCPPHTRWAGFGLAICESAILREGTVVFLGCCHGGLKRVALILFCNCPQIVTVCGPRWKVDQFDVALGLHTFLNNILIKMEEPDCAAARTQEATGRSFPIYNRFDLSLIHI